jgi:Domain of unknown function (DUF4258)
MGIKQIRRAIRDDQYQFTTHALDEMDEDGLTEEDVRHAILHGSMVTELTDDPRGVRFVVSGDLKDKDRKIEVVCRFLPSGLLRIITAYELEE